VRASLAPNLARPIALLAATPLSSLTCRAPAEATEPGPDAYARVLALLTAAEVQSGDDAATTAAAGAEEPLSAGAVLLNDDAPHRPVHHTLGCASLPVSKPWLTAVTRAVTAAAAAGPTCGGGGPPPKIEARIAQPQLTAAAAAAQSQLPQAWRSGAVGAAAEGMAAGVMCGALTPARVAARQPGGYTQRPAPSKATARTPRPSRSESRGRRRR
jgi:hypothetical protein